MNCRNFSGNTEEYLCRFNEILNEMICKMTEAELTDSLSHNFIVQMLPHHKAAVEMSENLLKYNVCPPLKEIAENIISEQTKSIEELQNALSCCENYKNSERDICLYQKEFSRISKTMFCDMRHACRGENINANFMREMIPHHEGAIRMSENILRFYICPQLCPIADAIIVSQRRGVCQMKQLLRCM